MKSIEIRPVDLQDLLDHYWKKMQTESDPELKLQWGYYVDRLTGMLLD